MSIYEKGLGPHFETTTVDLKYTGLAICIKQIKNEFLVLETYTLRSMSLESSWKYSVKNRKGHFNWMTQEFFNEHFRMLNEPN